MEVEIVRESVGCGTGMTIMGFDPGLANELRYDR